jgi:predicted aspartyl protease
MLRRLRALALAGLLAGCAAPLQQAACGVHAVGVVPFEMQGGAPVVTVRANGVPLRLALDTGAQITTVAPPAAAAAHLPVAPQIAFLAGIGGVSRRHFVRFDRASAGDVALAPFTGAMADLGMGAIPGPRIDGLLGVDVLGRYDLDLDIDAARVTFYEGTLCDPAQIPWGLRLRALDAYRRPPDYDGRFYLRATVNGTEVTALLDTGAGISGIADGVAARLPPPHAAQAARVGLSGSGAAAFSAKVERFGTLAVGGETIRDPVFALHDLASPELVLGNDYLGHRRVWLSFSSNQVFVATPGPRRPGA